MTKKKTDVKESEPAPASAAQNRLDVIQEMQAAVDVAARRVAGIKEDLKSAKELWEGRVEALGNFIRNGSMPLPFGEDEDKSENADAL